MFLRFDKQTMIKKIMYFLILNISYINTFWYSQWEMDPGGGNKVIKIDNDSEPLTIVFEYIKDSIFWLLWLISIGVFIYIWARLVVARWNPEEFKKAIMQLIYAVLWLFLVAISWLAVRLIAWLHF